MFQWYSNCITTIYLLQYSASMSTSTTSFSIENPYTIAESPGPNGGYQDIRWWCTTCMVCHRWAPKADDKLVVGVITSAVEGEASVQTKVKSDAPLVGVKREIFTMATDQPISESEKQKVKSIKPYLEIFSETCVIVIKRKWYIKSFLKARVVRNRSLDKMPPLPSLRWMYCKLYNNSL